VDKRLECGRRTGDHSGEDYHHLNTLDDHLSASKAWSQRLEPLRPQSLSPPLGHALLYDHSGLMYFSLLYYIFVNSGRSQSALSQHGLESFPLADIIQLIVGTSHRCAEFRYWPFSFFRPSQSFSVVTPRAIQAYLIEARLLQD